MPKTAKEIVNRIAGCQRNKNSFRESEYRQAFQPMLFTIRNCNKYSYQGSYSLATLERLQASIK